MYFKLQVLAKCRKSMSVCLLVVERRMSTGSGMARMSSHGVLPHGRVADAVMSRQNGQICIFFCSSVGQSERLLTVRSQVRALPGEMILPLHVILHGLYVRFVYMIFFCFCLELYSLSLFPSRPPTTCRDRKPLCSSTDWKTIGYIIGRDHRVNHSKRSLQAMA